MTAPCRRNRLFWLCTGAAIVLFFVIVRELAGCIDGISVAYSFHFTNVRNTEIINGQAASPCQSGNDNQLSKCQSLHVCMVCAGHEAARGAITVVKSLLFHRRNPVHLHLIVDENARLILETLFDSWKLPAVTLSLYDADLVVPDVSWIPNRHYSGVYGLLKLTLPKILPSNLNQVLVIDTDVLFVSDVGLLWRKFGLMSESEFIGLVENQSPWYFGNLYRSQIVWPALGRGFNTGVILMDLAKMRKYNWMSKWPKVAREHLQTLEATALADQDVFNTMIKTDPSILYRIPCEWNMQLGDRSMQHDICHVDPVDLKIVHWNSPQKTKVRSRYAEFFRRHYQTFVDMDGSLFRRELLSCQTDNKTQWEQNVEYETSDDIDQYDYDDDGCYEFRRASKIQYRTHVYYRRFVYESKPSGDVTLATQLSMDRLQLLVQLAEHWEGPISVAVYVSDAEARQMLLFVEESPLLNTRYDIAYHVVFKQGAFFPVNHLRNIALRHVRTPHVFMTDIDFVPMFALYDVLRQAIINQGSLSHKALVVAAFESQRYRPSSFPRSKTELLNQLDTGQLFVFRQDVWVKGHQSTDYDRWRTAAEPYSVGWRPEYEPYIVVDRDAPLYDTRFIGFGWNKVSHIMQLDAIGYDFIVLPNAFMIHMPHAPSFDIAKYRSSAQYRRCLKLLKSEFMKDLTKQRNRTRIIPIEATPLHRL